jgi:heptosyltransferase-2
MVAIAPGSVWNTKRWIQEHFVGLIKILVDEGYSIAVVGGAEDASLCQEIERATGNERVLNAAGRLMLLQSAELLRRCKVVVSNDSAPMHLAGAVGTPVVAIFGATVPQFGFGPTGALDEVVETLGLPCRPCSIHGGDACPIGTFVCMKQITPGQVLEKVRMIMSRISVRT